MRNVRIDVEYDGTGFSGWQRQASGISTVQGAIESVLGRILQEEITLDGAGRTDRGVHARGQTASFRTSSAMTLPRLMHSTNSLLPDTIRITAVKAVPEGFHARFSAVSREYRYFLIERPSAIDSRFAGCSRGRADLDVMNGLAGLLPGTHEFLNFSRENPREKQNTVCTVHDAVWYQYGRFLVFRIRANRFLRSMVRYLVAGMVDAGTGRVPADDFRSVLQGGQRNPGMLPAEASGLFLWKVEYGEPLTVDC
ncbi:MAG: tRNA pseudouridine(38-40) synthase TruA [Chlorobiaceae bacterium]|nr:tRNA pseudouridine(38-40) synthase TruA [Chlorobiaceae bacterium]